MDKRILRERMRRKKRQLFIRKIIRLGACAVAVASVLNGYTEEHVLVHLLGGDLKIYWDREENLVYMTGPAAVVFDGEIDL